MTLDDNGWLYLWSIKVIACGGILQGVLVVAGQAARGTPGGVHPIVIQLCNTRNVVFPAFVLPTNIKFIHLSCLSVHQ